MLKFLAIEVLKRALYLLEYQVQKLQAGENTAPQTQNTSSSKLQEIHVYTDGSIQNLGRKNAGGWAAVIVEDGKEPFILEGSEADCDDCNAMELLAAVKALTHLQHREVSVIIHSDSAYVVSTINDGGLENWQHNGWVTRKGGNVVNVSLWKEMIPLLQLYGDRVKFKKIAAHTGNFYNEMADKICGDRAKKQVYKKGSYGGSKKPSGEKPKPSKSYCRR